MSFFQKPFGATLLLGTALGTPYVLFETEPGTQLRQSVLAGRQSESQPAEKNGDSPGLQDPPSPDWSTTAHPPTDLRQVIRLDLTPDFVYRNFPRVSTVLSDLSFDGLRVPFISGTQSYDVAGSLTYYFDINKSLQRIQLQGVTGDPGPLIQLMIQHYRLTPQSSLGGQLLTMRWNNRVTSFIHIAPAPVVSTEQPNRRFAFFWEINKPADYPGLSAQATQILMQAQAVQRW